MKGGEEGNDGKRGETNAFKVRELIMSKDKMVVLESCLLAKHLWFLFEPKPS